MAKQKYELLPDKVVAANAETIKAIGHIATDTDIVDYVSGQLMRDYIKFGKKTLDEAAKLTEQTIMSDDFLDKLGAIKNMTNWYYSGRQVYLFDDDFASLLSGQGHSAPKAPHIRRAHFHGYHTNNGYQVKWLNTIFVNAERDDNDISTIHKVLQ